MRSPRLPGGRAVAADVAPWPLPRWLIAGALLLIVVAWTARALFIRYDEVGIDQMAFALVGQKVLAGHLPYTAVFDNKPVGLYYLYAASEWLFGQRYAPLQILSVLAPLLTAAIIARTARLLSPASGIILVAVALYFGLSLADEGFFPTSELLACPAVALGLHLSVRRALGRIAAPRFCLLAGVTLGLGAQISYLVIPIGGLVGLACLAIEINDGARLGLVLHYIGLATLGFGAAFLAVLVPQIISGEIGDYFTLQVHYHEAYANETSWRGFLVGSARMWPVVLPLVVAGLLWIATIGAAREARPASWPFERAGVVLAAGLAGALIASWLSHRFYLHYFILLVPPVVGLTILITQTLPRRAAVLALAASLLIGAGVSGLSAHRARAWRLAKPLDTQVSAYIRANTAPDQTIFVFDESPALYYLSGRQPVTRFVFPSHYMRKPEADALHLDLAAYVRQALDAHPALVIVGSLWLPENGFDIHKLLRAAGYRLQTTFAQQEIAMFLRERRIEVYRRTP